MFLTLGCGAAKVAPNESAEVAPGLAGPALWGLVVDDRTGGPARYVEVSARLPETGEVVAFDLTSDEGSYAISLPRAGPYDIFTSGVGHVTPSSVVEVGGSPSRHDILVEAFCDVHKEGDILIPIRC